MKTIEQQVADTILQQPTDEITIGGKAYPIGQPTPATLIMVSGLVSQLPEIDPKSDNILVEVLAKAKDCRIIGKVLAALILGAKRIKENHKIKVTIEHVEKRWSWTKFRVETIRHKEVNYESEYQYLSKQVLEECTVEELRELLTRRLLEMQVADFFAVTTSLCVTNLLKRTKEVETASGD